MQVKEMIPQSTEQALFFMEQVKCPARVVEHCKAVANTAEQMAKSITTQQVNLELVRIGALVHDIGRAKSHGIDHAVIGGEIARQLGFSEAVVRIIERHIGAGITPEEAEKMGLPPADYRPKSIEEKIVSHADNLTKDTEPQSIEECVESLRRQSVSEEVIERVLRLHHELSALTQL
jgi:uncharacterized protein